VPERRRGPAWRQPKRGGCGSRGGAYEITGDKWFCSAPMCDAFLVLAQAPGGLTCFLLPRFTPDGERNRFHLQRLKDKLGNRSNASSEVEFQAAWARRVGEEGRGVPTILEMVNHTRLDCVIGAAAGLRFGTAWAIHHARHRSAFGRLLVDQPLMRNVLADLAIESEAATVAMMRLARAYDETASPGDTGEAAAAFRRLATAVLKYWTTKRAPVHAAEALECLGGNGYVEEHGEGVMARIYREMPLNSIWEGAGNIMALDLMRALKKRGVTSGDAVQALDTELATTRGANAQLDRFADALLARLDDGAGEEIDARRLAQDVALAVQASLLRRHAPDFTFDAFCRSRLAGGGPQVFGTLPSGIAFDSIIQRAMPH